MDGPLALLWAATLVLALVALSVALLALTRLRDMPDRLVSRTRRAAQEARLAQGQRAGQQATGSADGQSSDEDAGTDWSQQRLDALEAAALRVADRLAALEGGPGQSLPVVTGGLGLVRFNAFDDTGGSQSFALALLDANEDGIVLSSLHSRQATRLYVKRVSGGMADVPLSDEETEALQQAGLRTTGAG